MRRLRGELAAKLPRAAKGSAARATLQARIAAIDRKLYGVTEADLAAASGPAVGAVKDKPPVATVRKHTPADVEREKVMMARELMFSMPDSLREEHVRLMVKHKVPMVPAVEQRFPRLLVELGVATTEESERGHDGRLAG